MVGEKPRQAQIANRQLMLEVALKPVSLSNLTDSALEWSGEDAGLPAAVGLSRTLPLPASLAGVRGAHL